MLIRPATSTPALTLISSPSALLANKTPAFGVIVISSAFTSYAHPARTLIGVSFTSFTKVVLNKAAALRFSTNLPR